MILSNAGVNPVATDVIFAVVMILLSIAVTAVAVWLSVKFIGKPKDEQPKGDRVFSKILAFLILGGVALRAVLMLTIKGHRGDFDLIAGTMEYVSANGFEGYYQMYGTQMYPLTLMLYSLLGVIANAINVTSASYAMVVFVKLPLIIADVVSALVIYKIAKKYVNGYIALVLSGAFLLIPAFMISSSVWGSIYSLLTMGLLLSLYFMLEKNFLGLFASYTASLLFMKDALYLFPLFAVFVIYGFVKSLRKVVKEKVPSKAIWGNPETCQTIRTPIYFVASVLVAYLISLPSILPDYGAGFFGWIYRFSLRPLGVADSFGENSLGIFNIFAKNGDALGSGFPTVVFAVIFAVIVLGIVLLVYLSKKNRANLVFLAAYIMFTLATYYVDFSAMSLIPMLAISLMAFALIKDKRILTVFGMMSLLVLINSAAALINAGYINNAADYLFEQSSFYTGSPLLQEGFGLVVSIICSVLAVLTHLYSTLVILDLSLSNKRKVLPYDENATLFKGIALWVKP